MPIKSDQSPLSKHQIDFTKQLLCRLLIIDSLSRRRDDEIRNNPLLTDREKSALISKCWRSSYSRHYGVSANDFSERLEAEIARLSDLHPNGYIRFYFQLKELYGSPLEQIGNEFNTQRINPPTAYAS